MSAVLMAVLAAVMNAQAPAEQDAAQPSDAMVQQIQEGFNRDNRAVANALERWEIFEWLADRPVLESAVMLSLVILLALVVHLIARYGVMRIVRKVLRKAAGWWGDVIHDSGVLHRIELLLPVIVLERGIQLVPGLSDDIRLFLTRLCLATIVLLVVMVFGACLTAINDIYARYPIARGRPIKGYLQVVKLLAYIAAGIMMITALLGLQPWWFVSGIGAMMAVILLIFRDTLLSLVAGIQLINNDLVRVGDWIEMPQFNADGDVIDISLHVVKVNNWDKTMTVIPAHKFLDHAFKNWRTMHEQGGRRIKRSIFIDMSTIRFLTQDEIARFSRFKLLKQYILDKSSEIAAYNQQHCPADAADVIANARHLTNIGTLRAYIANYLRQHPGIRQDMTFLIRQLAPTPQGLPLEIYVFTNDTRWPFYEGIQADIFDHILAITPEFGLRIYQEPSGMDVRSLRKHGDVPATPANLRPLGLSGPSQG